MHVAVLLTPVACALERHYEAGGLSSGTEAVTPLLPVIRHHETWGRDRAVSAGPGPRTRQERVPRRRVLVVEDHAKLAGKIADGLRRDGMAVDVALDGQDALDHASVTRYDIIVLDRDLPKVHGDEVCRSLLAGGYGSRILMLTAAGAIEDRVDGLGLGR